MKVGYIRISTKEQNTARQDELMKKLGVEKVYTDKMSGKNTERPELHKMMDFVREGDSLTVESISRFARNTRDLLDLTATLSAKGVQFISQKESIDTNTPNVFHSSSNSFVSSSLAREYGISCTGSCPLRRISCANSPVSERFSFSSISNLTVSGKSIFVTSKMS